MTVQSILQQMLTLLNNGTVATRPGVGTPGANAPDFVLETTETAVLFADTVKGDFTVRASDGSRATFHLPQGSTTPYLVSSGAPGGGAAAVAAAPSSPNWGVAHSGGNWVISNQTAGQLSFWKGGLLGG